MLSFVYKFYNTGILSFSKTIREKTFKGPAQAQAQAQAQARLLYPPVYTDRLRHACRLQDFSLSFHLSTKYITNHYIHLSTKYIINHYIHLSTKYITNHYIHLLSIQILSFRNKIERKPLKPTGWPVYSETSLYLFISFVFLFYYSPFYSRN